MAVDAARSYAGPTFDGAMMIEPCPRETDDLMRTRRRLLDTALDLARAQTDRPAGSVLRCYALAAQLAKLEGCSDAALSDGARAVAEVMLLTRTTRSTNRRLVAPSRRLARVGANPFIGGRDRSAALTADRT